MLSRRDRAEFEPGVACDGSTGRNASTWTSAAGRQGLGNHDEATVPQLRCHHPPHLDLRVSFGDPPPHVRTEYGRYLGNNPYAKDSPDSIADGGMVAIDAGAAATAEVRVPIGLSVPELRPDGPVLDVVPPAHLEGNLAGQSMPASGAEPLVPIVSPLAGAPFTRASPAACRNCRPSASRRKLRVRLPVLRRCFRASAVFRLHVIREFADRVRPQLEVIGNDEALHTRPLVEQQPHVRQRRWRAVVAGSDETAHGDPREHVEMADRGLERRAANVLEQAVDAAWQRLGKLFGEVVRPAVDAMIVAEFIDRIAAFHCAARNTDRMHPGDFRQLAHNGADRARRRGNDHYLTFFRGMIR